MVSAVVVAEEAWDWEVSLAVAAAAMVTLADEGWVDMAEMVILEAAAQEALVTELALEVGEVD